MNKRKILFKEYSGCISITRKDILKALKGNKFSKYTHTYVLVIFHSHFRIAIF